MKKHKVICNEKTINTTDNFSKVALFHSNVYKERLTNISTKSIQKF